MDTFEKQANISQLLPKTQNREAMARRPGEKINESTITYTKSWGRNAVSWPYEVQLIMLRGYDYLSCLSPIYRFGSANKFRR